MLSILAPSARRRRWSTGARLWVRRYNGPRNGGDYAHSIAVSPTADMVVVTGTSYVSSPDNNDYATISYSG